MRLLNLTALALLALSAGVSAGEGDDKGLGEYRFELLARDSVLFEEEADPDEEADLQKRASRGRHRGRTRQRGRGRGRGPIRPTITSPKTTLAAPTSTSISTEQAGRGRRTTTLTSSPGQYTDRHGRTTYTAPTDRYGRPVTPAKTTSQPPALKNTGKALAKYTGQGTWFNDKIGACGWALRDSDMHAAVSHLFYDSFPGATANPNNNPICGKQIQATYGGKTVTVRVVDKCMSCANFDLDFSPAAFQKLANLNVGRLYGMTWRMV